MENNEEKNTTVDKEKEKEQLVKPKPSKTAESTPKKREIIIITDGNSVEIKKAEVSGAIEFVGILNVAINIATKK